MTLPHDEQQASNPARVSPGPGRALRYPDSHLDTAWQEGLVFIDAESHRSDPDFASTALPRGDDSALDELPDFVNSRSLPTIEHVISDRKLPVIALLIPFSSIGVLIRIGLNTPNASPDTYPG